MDAAKQRSEHSVGAYHNVLPGSGTGPDSPVTPGAPSSGFLCGAAGIGIDKVSKFMGHASIAIIDRPLRAPAPGGEAESAALLDAYHERKRDRGAVDLAWRRELGPRECMKRLAQVHDTSTETSLRPSD